MHRRIPCRPEVAATGSLLMLAGLAACARAAMQASPTEPVPSAAIELGPRAQPRDSPSRTGLSSFTVHYNAVPGFPDASWLIVTVGEGERAQQVVPRQRPDGLPQLETIAVPDEGEMPVSVVARNAAGDTLARVAIRLYLVPEYAYWIVLEGRTYGRPTGRCVGPVTAVPLRRTGTPPESLFVWTGAIMRGAIYC